MSVQTWPGCWSAMRASSAASDTPFFSPSSRNSLHAYTGMPASACSLTVSRSPALALYTTSAFTVGHFPSLLTWMNLARCFSFSTTTTELLLCSAMYAHASGPLVV